jgi:hypothetical protein
MTVGMYEALKVIENPESLTKLFNISESKIQKRDKNSVLRYLKYFDNFGLKEGFHNKRSFYFSLVVHRI